MRALQGIGLALFHTASFTLVANISPEDHLGQSLGYFFLAPNVSLALLPSLGMFLINRFSFTFPLPDLPGFIVMRSLDHPPIQEKTCHSLGKPATEGMLFSRKAIPPSIVSFLNFIMWGAITAFFPLYALNCGVTNSGLFFTADCHHVFLGSSFRRQDIRSLQ